MAATQHDSPIACTLMAGDFEERLAWIADLNRDGLRASRRADLRLELTYDPAVSHRVREMVRREQECCAFLAFGLREEAGSITLTVDAPEEVRDGVDLVFEPFLARGASGTGCVCDPVSPGGGAPRGERRIGVVVAAIATGALACGVACIVPPAVPALGLTAAGSVLAWFAGIHAWVTAAAVAAVAGGWAWLWRRTSRTRRAPARSTLAMMGIATTLLLLALAWPSIEPHLIR
jgi:hypothetical protein